MKGSPVYMKTGATPGLTLATLFIPNITTPNPTTGKAIRKATKKDAN